MKHIGGHLKTTMQKSAATERGELMEYFRQRLNQGRAKDGYPAITMPRLGSMLTKIPTKDLYYLKRRCDDAQHFSKTFWWLLNPKKHTEEEEAPAPKKKRRPASRD
jgi:hypothetical protein